MRLADPAPGEGAPAAMIARTLVLGGAIVLIALLAFLTLSVALEDGVSVLVVFSIVVLAILGFGVLGALTSADDE